MMKRVDKHLKAWATCACLVLAAAAWAEEMEVQGVFGINPVPEGAALGIWVQVDVGEAVHGVRWFNNDRLIAFPRISAVAGEGERPQYIENAVSVGENVSGENSGWSEFTFSQPLVSETEGLYLIFYLPVGGDFQFEGEAGGCGLVYGPGDGQNRCWIATGDGIWNPLTAEVQMAVEPVIGGNKGGDVLVLRKNRTILELGVPEGAGEANLVASLGAVPNPFNPRAEIRFVLPTASEVNLTIFDVRGRAVRKLLSEARAEGTHVIVWDGSDDSGRAQASGVYIARLVAGPIRLTERITLMR